MDIDQPRPASASGRQPLRVAVVGGGASGVLVAARLLDASIARPVQVTVVDPGPRLAAGVAYGTDDPQHLLNVRASGMSADPSDPDDLVRWIRARGEGDSDTFVPRRDYRAYLEQHLRHAADTAPAATLDIVRDRVVALEVQGDEVRVVLAAAGALAVDRVVLAVGNSAPAVPAPLDQLDGHPAWVADPWAPGALTPHQGAERVVLVGSGLTMVDLAITLGRGRSADAPPMISLSRSGLLPRCHLPRQPHRPIDVIDLERDGADVLALQERLRARIVDREGVEYDDEDWREVIDAVRPFANALWRRFDPTQRRIFLTQVMRNWDVHRHRMSPETGARLETLRTEGRLRTHLGQVLRAEPDPADASRVRLEVELDGEVVVLAADAVVNCTGPGRSWLPPENPVVADLVRQGVARPDPFGLGLETTPEGSLVDRDGAAVPQILVIGPPRRGSLFETTAVPELRSQALHIADHLVIGDPFA